MSDDNSGHGHWMIEPIDDKPLPSEYIRVSNATVDFNGVCEQEHAVIIVDEGAKLTFIGPGKFILDAGSFVHVRVPLAEDGDG